MNLRVRASAVCESSGKVLLVKLKDPLTGVVRLFPPGGAVEEGEFPHQTAERETWEETGYRVRCLADLSCTIDYPFTWAGKIYDCKTHFFRAVLLSDAPDATRDESYNLGAEWVDQKSLEAQLSFHHLIRDAVLSVLRR